MKEVFLGIDFATQSARAVLLDIQSQIHARISQDLAPVQRGADGRLTQDPTSWLVAIDSLLAQIRAEAEKAQLTITAMCITATSGTFVLTDSAGTPIAQAAMYNDGRAGSPLGRAEKIVAEVGAGEYLFAHTAEYLVAHLTGAHLSTIATDWSHALKTGVDIQKGTWKSDAISQAHNLGISLPSVVAPGTLLGKTTEGSIPIYAGMTDGCTAQISVGDTSVGSAVSTLGTTLVLKVIADKEITGPGFYSHLLPENRWLAGAASNLGGISFDRFKSEIEQWDNKAAKYGPSSTAAYPLVGTGERFPIASKDMKALSARVPKDEVDEYRSILEGIAFAERLSFEILKSAGAAISGNLYTVGGGSKSAIWSRIRATVLQRPISIVKNSGSDIGAAMIAAAGHRGADIGAGLDIFNSSISQVIEANENEIEALESRYQEFLLLVGPFQIAGIR
jgi:xylulokinase